MEVKEKPVLITQRMQLLLPLDIVASQGWNPGYDLFIKRQVKIHLGQPRKATLIFSLSNSEQKPLLQKEILAKDQHLLDVSLNWSLDETQKAFSLLHDPTAEKKKPSLIFCLNPLQNIMLYLHTVCGHEKDDKLWISVIQCISTGKNLQQIA